MYHQATVFSKNSYKNSIEGNGKKINMCTQCSNNVAIMVEYQMIKNLAVYKKAI